MKTLICICMFALTITLASTQYCKGLVKFDGKFYEKEYLADGTVSKPFFMTYLKDSNKIVFCEDAEPLGDTATYLLDLKTKELTKVSTANNAVANVIDNKGTVYIGQEGGLFKFDINTQEMTPTNLKDVMFYTMLVKDDKIFYTDYPNKDLYVYENGETKLLEKGLDISDIIFDSKNNAYYYNKTGLYVKYANTSETVQIETIEYAEVPLVGLILDGEKIYAMSVYGVFKVDTENKKTERISLKSMYDIVFDDDNHMIYSDEESIVRLIPTSKTC